MTFPDEEGRLTDQRTNRGNNRAYAVFITGVPSSGKTSVARVLCEMNDSMTRVDGDEVIRETSRSLVGGRTKLNPAEAVEIAARALSVLIDQVEGQMMNGSVVTDAPFTKKQIAAIRERLGGRAVCVVLRVSGGERTRREKARHDRSPLPPTRISEALLGADDEYDLVIDTTGQAVHTCAEAIAAHLEGR